MNVTTITYEKIYILFKKYILYYRMRQKVLIEIK